MGYTATNVSVLRPHGVWVVISPFNFPAALTAGPAGAALVAGNTIVIVTHEEYIADHAHRIVRLLDGRIEIDEKTKH